MFVQLQISFIDPTTVVWIPAENAHEVDGEDPIPLNHTYTTQTLPNDPITHHFPARTAHPHQYECMQLFSDTNEGLHGMITAMDTVTWHTKDTQHDHPRIHITAGTTKHTFPSDTPYMKMNTILNLFAR
jgi:hypothetical protein